MNSRDEEFKRYVTEQYDRNKIDDEEFVFQMQQINWVTSDDIFNVLDYDWKIKFAKELL